MKAHLLFYVFHSFCQGSRDRGEAYALVYVPANATFENVRSRLIVEFHRLGVHEIELSSIEDRTIF